MARFELPRTYKGLFVSFARKVGDLQANEHLRGIGNVNCRVDVIGNERTVGRRQTRIDAEPDRVQKIRLAGVIFPNDTGRSRPDRHIEVFK